MTDLAAFLPAVIALCLTLLNLSLNLGWAWYVRRRDKRKAQQLKLSEITSRYTKDGIQDAGYELGDYLIALAKERPGKLWEVLTTGRASELAPEVPGSADDKLSFYRDNLSKVYSLVRKVAGFWHEVASLWMTDALPPGFWGGAVKGGDHVWLHRANSHRVHHEQFSIATYYRLGFDNEGKKPYKDSRPMRFWLIQQQWVKWMLEKAGKNEKPPSCMSTLQKLLREWAKLGLKKDKEDEKETKSKTVLDCKSTLRGWAVQDLWTHRKVQSGAWKEVDLAELESELPEKWQIRPRASDARVPAAASDDIEFNAAYPRATILFTEISP